MIDEPATAVGAPGSDLIDGFLASDPARLDTPLATLLGVG